MRSPLSRKTLLLAIIGLVAALGFALQAAFAETPDVGNDKSTATQQNLPIIVDRNNSNPALRGSLGSTDPDDCYKVSLHAGKYFVVDLYRDPAFQFQTRVYGPDATSTATDGGSTPVAVSDAYTYDDQYLAYPVEKDGLYYLDVKSIVTSQTGNYGLYASEEAAPYLFHAFTVPTKAKKNKAFSTSVVLTPDYIGTKWYPVTFYAEKRAGGKWGSRKKIAVHGTLADDATKYAVKFKLTKGTWRIWAVLKDSDHNQKTKTKQVKVK